MRGRAGDSGASSRPLGTRARSSCATDVCVAGAADHKVDPWRAGGCSRIFFLGPLMSSRARAA
eukprot:6105011-Lingulodinium_polyedra.AAC.1